MFMPTLSLLSLMINPRPPCLKDQFESTFVPIWSKHNTMHFTFIHLLLALAQSLADLQTDGLDGYSLDLMLLRYIVSPVTVQGHASDYKAVSLQHPINHFLSPFFLSACLLSSGIISQPFCHHLHFICYCYTSIWSLLAWIILIIVLSVHFGIQIHSDCLHHARKSLLLTLPIYSTAIESQDKSILTPTTINCSTWAFCLQVSTTPFSLSTPSLLQYWWTPPTFFQTHL